MPSPRHFVLVLGTLLACAACGGKVANESVPYESPTHADPFPPGSEGPSDEPSGGVSPGTGAAPVPEKLPPAEATEPDVDGDPFVAGDAPTSLAAVREKLVGRWVGVARTPWQPVYRVELSFSSGGASDGGFGGTYASRCIETARSCIALYWGVDGAGGARTFALADILANGSVSGTLTLVFDAGTTVAGTLRSLYVDRTGDRLRFEVLNRGYGPVVLDLRRAP